MDNTFESCNADDNSQVMDTAGVVISYRPRDPGIRANPSQAALLKKAYELSSAVSSEQAKALAEETGLPPKWIQQWFSRQRSKERKKNINYKPKCANTNGSSATRPQQGASLATFSAAFFSDSVSSSITTGNTSVQEIKMEYQDGPPFVSGSTNVEELASAAASESPYRSAPLSASRLPGGLDTVTNEDSVSQNTGNGRKTAPIGKKNRKALHSRTIPASNRNARTKSIDSGGFRLLKMGKNKGGLNLSEGVQPGPDAYTPTSSPALQGECASAPSTHPMLPRIFPPRSRVVTPDHAIRSTGRQPKDSSRPSVVNIPMDKSKAVEPFLSAPVATVRPSAASKDLAVSFVPPHRHNDNLLICAPRDAHSVTVPAEAQIANAVSCSMYPAPSAANCLSKASPLIAVASGLPDCAVDNFVENPSVIVSSSCPENDLTFMPYNQQVSTYPSDTRIQYYSSTVDPANLEALDPLRAPLKHLTGVLPEYRGEDGAYLSLLVGLQNPACRQKIVGCLSNEELVLRDPFAAAMGLVLLSRLGIL